MTDFAALHRPGNPLRLVNAWDAFSARVLALSGAPAIATSSFAVAFWRAASPTVNTCRGPTSLPR